MKPAGKKTWVIPGIRIPLQSTGKEPELLSQDRISVLNTGTDAVNIRLTIFQSTGEPVIFKTLEIKPEKVRKIRINDLIDPIPVELETDYSLLVEADGDIIVQFLRMDTSASNRSITGTIAFGTD